jgi:hypothetical protein
MASNLIKRITISATDDDKTTFFFYDTNSMIQNIQNASFYFPKGN